MKQHPLYTHYFNGVDGYVDCGGVTGSLDITGNELTLEAWIKPDVLTGERVILSKHWSQYHIELFGASVHLAITTSGTVDLYSATALIVGRWYHVAGVYDGSLPSNQMKIFINGVEDANHGTQTGNIAHAAWPVNVGRQPTGHYYFGGSIALPCIYNRALSRAEIWRNIYNPLNPIRDGLVLFLPMIEGVGTAVNDYSGLGNNGTLCGGVSWRELMKYEIPAAAGL
jgi:hypothetical protein